MSGSTRSAADVPSCCGAAAPATVPTGATGTEYGPRPSSPATPATRLPPGRPARHAPPAPACARVARRGRGPDQGGRHISERSGQVGGFASGTDTGGGTRRTGGRDGRQPERREPDRRKPDGRKPGRGEPDGRKPPGWKPGRAEPGGQRPGGPDGREPDGRERAGEDRDGQSLRRNRSRRNQPRRKQPPRRRPARTTPRTRSTQHRNTPRTIRNTPRKTQPNRAPAPALAPASGGSSVSSPSSSPSSCSRCSPPRRPSGSTHTGDPAPGTHTRHKDALWLGHAWVDGRKTDRDVEALARRLRGTGIRDLYVHSARAGARRHPPASAYPKARWLTAAVHRGCPASGSRPGSVTCLASEGPTGAASGAPGHPRGDPRLDPRRPRRRLPGRPLRPGAPALRRPPLPRSPRRPARADPRPGRRALRRRPPDRPAARLPLLLGHHYRPPQVVVAGVLRAGGAPGGPDRRHVVRHHAAAAEPVRRLWRSRPAPRAGGHPEEHRPAPWACPSTTRTGSATGRTPRPSRRPCGAYGWACPAPTPDRADFGVALYVDFAATEDDWTAYRRDWVRTP